MSESELEDHLRTQRPAAPSSGLERRIAAELNTRPLAVAPGRVLTAGTLPRPEKRGLPGWLSGFAWATAGAALAVVTIVTVPQAAQVAIGGRIAAPAPASTAAAAVDPAVFEPAESTREVLATEKAGVVYDDSDGPRQETLYSSLERHVWRNQATGAEVTVEIPREDFVLTAASYQ